MEARTVEATDAVLRLTASLMQSAFDVLGEGAILGTMPGYLERFGKANARHVAKHFVTCRPETGAVQALTPINHVSRVTGTPFQLPMARKDAAVKRLETCEFRSAFEGLGDFPKAMICQLHEAVYQGSVNGLLEDEEDGYDVTVNSRILFGDPHCDFEVQSRRPRPEEPDEEGPSRPVPPSEEAAELRYHFYTYILASFVDYLSTMLPEDRVHALCEEAGARDGAAAGVRGDGAMGTVQELLRCAGREAERDGDTVKVAACPQEAGIRQATHGDGAQEARRAACGMCRAVCEGAAREVDPKGGVRLEKTLTVEGDGCLFRLSGRQA